MDQRISIDLLPGSPKSPVVRPTPRNYRRIPAEHYQDARDGSSGTDRQQAFLHNLNRLARALGTNVLPVDFQLADGQRVYLDRGCVKMAERAGVIGPLANGASGVVDSIYLRRLSLPTGGGKTLAHLEGIAAMARAEPSVHGDTGSGSEGSLPPLVEPLEADTTPFKPASIQDARNIVSKQIKVRRGQQDFRKALLRAYGNRCAITGCPVVDVLEAAHIYPFRGADTNHPSNGLLLRADLHTLLDCGLIAIDPDQLILVVAQSIRGSAYGKLHGRVVRARKAGAAPLSRDALRIKFQEFQSQHGLR